MTIRTLLCAAFALVAGVAQAQAPVAAGSYDAQTADARCRVLLDAAAAPLPESGLRSRDEAGLALAAPNCPPSLAGVALWRYSSEPATLTLFDASGAALAETVADGEGGWRGALTGGGDLRLAPR